MFIFYLCAYVTLADTKHILLKIPAVFWKPRVGSDSSSDKVRSGSTAWILGCLESCLKAHRLTEISPELCRGKGKPREADQKQTAASHVLTPVDISFNLAGVAGYVLIHWAPVLARRLCCHCGPRAAHGRGHLPGWNLVAELITGLVGALPMRSPALSGCESKVSYK